MDHEVSGWLVSFPWEVVEIEVLAVICLIGPFPVIRRLYLLVAVVDDL